MTINSYYGRHLPWHKIITILRSLKNGSTLMKACEGADYNYGSLYSLRRKYPRLEQIIEDIYDARCKIVEDALYQSAIKGNPLAQKFFLTNRSYKRWREKIEVENTGKVNNQIIIIRANEQEKKPEIKTENRIIEEVQ